MTGQAGSISPRPIDRRAEVGAAWWLLCSPSPAASHASHCVFAARLAWGRLPNEWPTAFTAAFAVGLAEGLSDLDAVRWGCAAGAYMVEHPGVVAGLPTRAQLEAKLESVTV